jgi:hypothetical protein
MVPASERAKTVHALEHEATVTGASMTYTKGKIETNRWGLLGRKIYFHVLYTHCLLLLYGKIVTWIMPITIKHYHINIDKHLTNQNSLVSTVGLTLFVTVGSIRNYCEIQPIVLTVTKQTKKKSVVLVSKRTMPTERPPLVDEVSANFCG